MTEQNKPKGRCFPRRHMLPQVDAFYWYAYRRSKKTGVFWRSDRKAAEDFGASKNTTLGWVTFLEREGWFEPLRTGAERLKRNLKTGMYDPIPYRVLTHEEWVAKHPNECRHLGEESEANKRRRLTKKRKAPVPKTGTGPVPESGTGPVPDYMHHQSQITCTTSPRNWDVCSKDSVVKEEKEESSRPEPPLSLPSNADKASAVKTVIEDIECTAKNTNRGASFSGKAKTMLSAWVASLLDSGTNIPKKVLRELVAARIKQMTDDRDLKNAGHTLAVNLPSDFKVHQNQLAAKQKHEQAKQRVTQEAAESQRLDEAWMERFKSAESSLTTEEELDSYLKQDPVPLYVTNVDKNMGTSNKGNSRAVEQLDFFRSELTRRTEAAEIERTRYVI